MKRSFQQIYETFESSYYKGSISRFKYCLHNIRLYSAKFYTTMIDDLFRLYARAVEFLYDFHVRSYSFSFASMNFDCITIVNDTKIYNVQYFPNVIHNLPRWINSQSTFGTYFYYPGNIRNDHQHDHFIFNERIDALQF